MKYLARVTILSALGLASASAVALTTPSGAAAVHGRVMASSEHDVVISLGSADRVAVGDQVTVYRSTLVGTPKQIPYFTDATTGQLRIEKILAPHSARAVLLSGVADSGEWVIRR